VTGPLVVLSAVGSTDDAERIARSLVETGLAACVNLVPGVVSFYRWKGKLERDAEVLLLVKTTGERFEDLKTALVAQHPYELPEVLAVPISAGHEPYLEWLAASGRE